MNIQTEQGSLNDFLYDLPIGYEQRVNLRSIRTTSPHYKQEIGYQTNYSQLFNEIRDRSSINSQLDKRKKEEFQYVNYPPKSQKTICYQREVSPHIDKRVSSGRPQSTSQQRYRSKSNMSCSYQQSFIDKTSTQISVDYSREKNMKKNRSLNNSYTINRSSQQKKQQLINEEKIDLYMLPATGFTRTKNPFFIQNNKALKKNHYLLKTTVKQELHDTQQKPRYTTYDQSYFRLCDDMKQFNTIQKEFQWDQKSANNKKQNTNNDSSGVKISQLSQDEISNIKTKSITELSKNNKTEYRKSEDNIDDIASEELTPTEYDQLLIDQEQLEKYENTRKHFKNLVMNKWEKSQFNGKQKQSDDPQDFLRKLDTLQWAKNHKRDKFKSFNKYKQLIEYQEFDNDGNPIPKKQKEQARQSANKHHAPEFIKRIMDVAQLSSAPRQNWAKLNNKLFIAKAFTKNLNMLSQNSLSDCIKDNEQVSKTQLDENDDCISQICGSPKVKCADELEQVSENNISNNNNRKLSASGFSQSILKFTQYSKASNSEKENLTFSSLAQKQNLSFIQVIDQKQEEKQKKVQKPRINTNPSRVNTNQQRMDTNPSKNNIKQQGHTLGMIFPTKTRSSSQQFSKGKLQNSFSESITTMSQKLVFRNTHQEVMKGLDQIINELSGKIK